MKEGVDEGCLGQDCYSLVANGHVHFFVVSAIALIIYIAS